MSRATWDQHYKILSTGNKVEPTEFAVGSNATTWTSMPTAESSVSSAT